MDVTNLLALLMFLGTYFLRFKIQTWTFFALSVTYYSVYTYYSLMSMKAA